MTFNTELWNTQTPGAAGYEIERSLRFNSADSAYLNRTPASAGNRKTWTWAGWVKRSSFGTSQYFFGNYYNSANDGTSIRFTAANQINIFDLTSGSFAYQLTSTQVFRDPSAWYHFVISLDTTQSTAADRLKVYVNGSQVTIWTTSTYPTQNTDYDLNNTQLHTIGRSGSFAGQYFDGYLADVHFIDGQALDPTDFGEFDDNGVWQPIDASGLTYGTNGFHLPFSDNSSASALGTDDSGNGNDWTVNNITAIPSNSPNAAGAVTAGAPFNATYPWTTAFDGSITLVGAVGNAAGADSYKWTFGNTLTGTTAAFVVHDTYVPDFDLGNKAAINGTALTSSNWTKTTNTLPVASGNPSDYKVYTYSLGGSSLSSVGVSSSVRIAAVLLDGVPLVYDSLGTNDSLLDSPTNGDTANDTGAGGEVPGNYATLNPLHMHPNNALGNGNLDITGASSAGATCIPASIALPSSGKFYCEFTNTGGTTPIRYGIGIEDSGRKNFNSATGTLFGGYGGYYRSNGDIWNASSTQTGSTYTVGDVISIAVDTDTGKFWFAKNGIWQLSGNPAAGTNQIGTLSGLVGAWFFGCAVYDTDRGIFNAGQRPFAYSAPSGFKALCTANLDTPTIEDPSTVMDVATYAGTGSSQTITLPGTGFDPDFIWIKRRNLSADHVLYDAVRGFGTSATKTLYSNLTNSEDTTSVITSTTSTGFNLSGSGAESNAGTGTYVAWTWDAGETTDPANTDGSISSSVRANPTAGFSIMTFTMPVVSSATIGHGLNVAPAFYVWKDRDTADSWYTYHSALGAGKYLTLNGTSAEISNTNIWNNTAPSSSVINTGNTFSNTGPTLVYAFAPVEGYSAFGSYTGNGLADGPFVYTGFRPRWVMVKRTDSTGNWIIWDAERSGYNTDNDTLAADSSNVENALTNSNELDILSNGFKLVASRAILNASAGTFIYAAFAEHPFRSSRAR